MKYEIIDCTIKGADWKVVTVRDENGVTTNDVNVNGTERDGTPSFPDFAQFAVGYTFDGKPIWTSSTGRKVIFHDKGRKTFSGSGTAGAGAQARKAEGIKHAQENKEKGIKIAGAMRDATLVTIASLKDQPFPTNDDFKREWTFWRDWFIKQFDNLSNPPDLPF